MAQVVLMGRENGEAHETVLWKGLSPLGVTLTMLANSKKLIWMNVHLTIRNMSIATFVFRG